MRSEGYGLHALRRPGKKIELIIIITIDEHAGDLSDYFFFRNDHTIKER